MRIERKFIVKNFWPRRSDAKGFSIKNLSNKYLEKFSSVSSKKNANKLLEERNLIFENEDSKHIDMPHISIKREHWANRDFSEYRDAA